MKVALFIMFSILCLIKTVSCQAQTAVPYCVDFEDTDPIAFYIGALDGQNSWQTSGTGSAVVTGSSSYSGGQSVFLDGDVAAELIIDAIDTAVLWIDGFVRTEGSTESLRIEPLPAVSSILDFHSIDGLKAFDGDGHGSGIMIDLGVPINPQQWRRITIKQDYSSKKWDLYVDGVMVRSGLGFHSDSVGYLEAFAHQNHTSAYLDFFSVTALGLEFDSDGDLLKDLDEYKFYKTDPFDADTDDDNVNDGVEIAAGTDPLDPGSYFKITSVDVLGDTMSISWSTVFGKSYIVQGTPELITGWIDISDTVTETDPAGGIAEFIHDFSGIGSPKYFYRIKIVNNN